MNPTNKYSRYFTYIKPITRIPIVRTYGSTIFTFVAMSIFVIFAIKPTVETIITLQKKLEDSRQVLEQVTKKAENLSLGKQNYDTLDTAIKSKIQTSIPNSLNLTTLVSPFELSAESFDATISAVQIQPLTIENKPDTTFTNRLSEVSFTINIEGPYERLLQILEQIQKSSRLISIDNLTINKGAAGSTNLLMSIAGKAYYLR